MEIVGTIKKVYSLVSKYGGTSLPEPARTQVREALLNLPTNWTISVNNSFFSSSTAPAATEPPKDEPLLTTNGKALILAKESLNVVRNIMDVVDSSLGKAEEWVKQKQELKEMIREQFLQRQLSKTEEVER